jgi:hypothetical protein
MKRTLIAGASALALTLAACGTPPPVGGGVPGPVPIDFASFFAGLRQAAILECGFVPDQAMVIAIFNAGAAEGFKSIADRLCAIVQAKSAVPGVRPVIVINGISIPVAGVFAK